MMRQLEESNVKAVDVDGTMADDSVIDMDNYSPEIIGPPIKKMVDRVKSWMAQGCRVVIFTARVHPGHGLEEVAIAEAALKEWSREVFGVELEITCMKDPMFSEIWDDKAVRVDKNTGDISTQHDVVDTVCEEEADQIGEFFD